ncbi:MAG: hypothetical protein COC01_07140 [Bacteroidetes bacterium]|nr:MAG: hypothetical protein COC01_07140 [Bacteroidota bacterium]
MSILNNLLFLLLFTFSNFLTPFEKSKEKETATYEEAISYYQNLAYEFDEISISEFGETDIGKPLHLVTISSSREFDPQKIKRQNKIIILINNGIHPGEPEGIDASMMLARDLVTKPELMQLLDHVVIGIIPIYNIGGSMNRGCCSRANQNGPVSYGFRGNAKNLDLNRDFIKCDSKNAKAFTQIFHHLDPDIFIDTHTSNGADYQYVMTYIATQKDKLHPLLADYMTNTLNPEMEKRMKSTGHEMSPYVFSVKSIPDSGIMAYLETPRYSSGYTTLFNTISYITETHMLKSFDKRVWSTYHFLKEMIAVTNNDYQKIREIRKQAKEQTKTQQEFTLTWELDKNQFKEINFNGYQAKYIPSEITGKERLKYDRSKPYSKKIRFYDSYSNSSMIEKPYAYVIPQVWSDVIELLKLNQVTLYQIPKDTSLKVDAYYIEDFTTAPYPFEGHYLHSVTTIKTETQTINFYKGDYYVITNQGNNRYIIETLEPGAHDSFFNWNFFDNILQQKEYFSNYVFEDKALEILNEDQELRTNLEKLKQTDTSVANSPYKQLEYIYKHTNMYESSHLRYPIYRLTKSVKF